ncbi:MAG TPA: flavin reductase [bacterium]|nr:flavin reductase [bacterium]
MCNFKTIVPEEAKLNPFLTLKNEWGLLTAGTFEDFNMMTIAWGYFGIMWNKPVFGAVVRPNRYTYEFMEKNSTFTVSFFPPEFRAELEFCGSKSGRDVNKVFETSFEPVDNNGSVYFSQADIVLVCTKLCFQDFDPENFVDPEIIKHYPEKSFHRLYIGEITQTLQKEKHKNKVSH